MSFDQITDAIRDVLNEGSRAVLITIAQSKRLAVGGKMLVKANRETVGDLGDSALNRVAVEHANAFLTAREDAKMLVVSDSAPELTELADTSLLFERIEAEPHLVIAGAGHVGASLARLAALIGYRVTLIDDRAEFVARELFSAASDANIELISASDWATSIKEAIGNGHGVAVAIVTRGHKQDEECLRAASSASPDYIGMIGSKRRTNIVLEKLREEGFDPQLLTKVRAPIGLDIGAISPEGVAVAILAEIIAERRGGSGAPLSKWRRT
jgi:xanthine/CO dehydrogenase XdhC/CoxF family maturation factor